ncbi:uncharacterized protein RB166_006232 [Leptodactylus fuscus]
MERTRGAQEAVLFSAACCLAFFGALRVGELVSPSRNKLGGLLNGDVVVSGGVLRVRIRRSKTDVLGQGKWCQFEFLLKEGLRFLGLPPGDFGTHSFRIGAATEAARAGLNEEEVKRVGRWKSGCYARQRDPVVIILGHSYVYWAALRAEVRPGGSNLGFQQLQLIWRGIRGLRWGQILSEAVDLSRSVSGPVVLVIHAGGNDLCFVRMAKLLAVMRFDLERIPGFFPEMVLVWSEIVPRLRWQGSRDPESAERCRRSVNARMARFVRSRGGVVVRHRQLEGDNSRLLRADGVHLNEIGLDIFLSGLQDGVEQALFLLGGGRCPV